MKNRGPKATTLSILSVALLWLVSTSPVELQAQQQTRKVYERVGQSDTLGSIALEYGVSVRELKRWNGIDEIGQLRSGMRLLVHQMPPPKPRRVLIIHDVKKDNTELSDIREQYGVSANQIREWNDEIGRLEKGDQLRIYTPDIRGYSRSVGRASGGKLINGYQFREARGLDVREPDESYGTRRTIRMIKAAVADIQARWPKTPNIKVWDLSYKEGGHMPQHASHQSGRDIDVSYYQKDDASPDDPHAQRIDPVRNWYLFTTLIETGEVEYIFVAYPLQKVLYEYARSVGYTEQQLEKMIQYPRPKSQRVGIIREVGGGHETHAHIRFTCTEKDKRCR